MVELLCPKCRRPSYTANTQGPWFCPYCGAEIDLGLDKARLLECDAPSYKRVKTIQGGAECETIGKP